MKISSGKLHPLGHFKQGELHNFSVFSDRGFPLTLVIYPQDKHLPPLYEIPMEQTGRFFHIALSPLPKDFTYTYRIDSQEVFDPYAKELTTSCTWGEPSLSVRSYPYDPEPFDWEGIQKPHLPLESLIIYEMHVRGFGQWTFQEMINKVSYLKQLGINAVELLPIHAFDETQTPFPFSPSGRILYNYWGYNTLSFFEPKRSYAKKGSSPTVAFKTLVKELHRQGIEVILDVVYNHVSPTSPLLYLAPSTYFLFDEEGRHANYTGCGNTVHCNHPQTIDLILSSLRYYAEEMQVDGFRFDLASIFCRTYQGHLLASPPILEKIAKDPVLSKLKLISEAWDASGLYQVGSFPSPIFAEWNDYYRNNVRQFVKGDSGKKEAFIQAMIGSKAIYRGKKAPCQSINFITCHDGFTLMDLLSYNSKHNEENGEDNRDGANDNHSWNCGIEGRTEDPAVLDLREKQFRNHMVALLLAQGTPLFFMGDEIGQTHFGNNNAYSQDTSWNWFAWDEVSKEQERFLFVKKLILLRKQFPFLQRTTFLQDNDLHVYNESLLPNMAGSERFVAFQILDILFYAFNANNFSLTMKLPPCKPQYVWKILIQETIFEEATAPLASNPIALNPYTCLILLQIAR